MVTSLTVSPGHDGVCTLSAVLLTLCINSIFIVVLFFSFSESCDGWGAADSEASNLPFHTALFLLFSHKGSPVFSSKPG